VDLITGGGVQPVALDELGPDYGDIGRSVIEYAFWTVEYPYTYGPATGLAEAFLKYRRPGPRPGTPHASRLLIAGYFAANESRSKRRARTSRGDCVN
jgi:hypothetical protein